MKKAVVIVVVALILSICALAFEDYSYDETSYSGWYESTGEPLSNEALGSFLQESNVDFDSFQNNGIEATVTENPDGTYSLQANDWKIDYSDKSLTVEGEKDGSATLTTTDNTGYEYAATIYKGEVEAQKLSDHLHLEVAPIDQEAKVDISGLTYEFGDKTEVDLYAAVPRDFDFKKTEGISEFGHELIVVNDKEPIMISKAENIVNSESNEVGVQGDISEFPNMLFNGEYAFDSESKTVVACQESTESTPTTAAIADITGMGWIGEQFENWKAGCQSIIGGKVEIKPNEPAGATKQPATETKKKAEAAGPDYVQAGIKDRKAAKKGSPLFKKLEDSLEDSSKDSIQ